MRASIVVPLLLSAIFTSTASTQNCACELMAPYFTYEKVVTDPEVIGRTSVVFTLHGKLNRDVKDVKVTAISSYCVAGNCIPLDTRVLECCNASSDFRAGAVAISVRTEIPSYAPFGEYNVKLLYEAEVQSERVQFACAETDFDL
ncbi:UDP-N-acetylmuramoylalanyl-D-glutamyl-2,6-diaminopimelate/D-alanyl-D-alanyl ligase [Perkinsela sp. CCAP 1560/4]|nr:UDP-N-acetylmuramoylalanyl-D-glutamyl-2,6-diaminopimelate/D-alanyl-D-alanyl ligase [Perkinsela sp. CCAP 1560/4]|eukprot:KNH04928.1 UDP-N-acetylmuramoylalanyl-D-glutamyl-2,6-diaminopimelate/D-alanyl-D-alanyl ligase [Perkinsela sp. CCAP 1560/4]